MSTSPGEKSDLRIQKSKIALCTAIFQLLERNSFAKITVNDICATAMVSRTTFYQHFPDKYALMVYSLQEASQELHRHSPGDLKDSIAGLLGFVYDKRKLFLNLLSDHNEELFRMLNHMTVSGLKEDLERSQQADAFGGVPAELLAIFLSGGMASLLFWWIGSDLAMSKEDLAGHLMAMFGLEGES